MAGTFVGATAAGTANVDSLAGSWPAGVASGDIALFPWSFVNTGTPTDPPEDAMSLLADTIKGSDRLRCLYRYCDGSESGTITAATTGTFNRQTWLLAVFRGYQYISGFAVRQEATSGTSHANPTLTTADGFGGNTPAAGDTIVIISSARDGSTTTGMAPPAGYNTRTNTKVGISGSGGTSTALADDGLGNAATFPTTPGSWTSYAAATASAVEMTISLRPVVTGSTATLTAIMAGMLTANSASAILAATATATLAGMAANMSSNVLATANMPLTMGNMAVSMAEASKITSTLAPSMANMTAAAAETSKATASTTLTMSAMTSTQTGQAIDPASLTGSMSSLVASAVVAGLITSSLAGALPAVSASSSGSLIASSSAVMAMPAMALALAETSKITATMTSSLQPFSAATNGSASAIGGLAGALPPMTVVASGNGRSSAILAETMPGATAALSGSSSDAAGLTQTLPGLTAGAIGQATSQADVQFSPLPAAVDLTGQVEVPDTPVGTVLVTLPSAGMSATEASLNPTSLVANPSTPVSAINIESVAEAGVGSILPSPSLSATGEGTLGAEVALTMPAVTAAMDGSSSEAPMDGQVGIVLPVLGVDLGGEARADGTLGAGLPSMSLTMAQTPPQLSLICYIEPDQLIVGVEDDVLAYAIEAESTEVQLMGTLYSYVEGNRLEAIVQ